MIYLTLQISTLNEVRNEEYITYTIL